MNREQLIAGLIQAAQVSVVAVPVPEWGGDVFIRPLTVAEVEQQTDDVTGDASKTRIARSVCRVLCDKDGNRLLDADNADDVAYISKQPWPLLQRLLAVSRKANGGGEEGAEEAKND